MAEMYGVKAEGRYLKMNGDTVDYPTYPWETPQAACERAKSAMLKRVKWMVVDSKDFPIED